MSDKISGQVFRIYEKQFPNKPVTYSIKLEDNPIYYRTNTNRYAGIAEPGNRVEFMATMNSDGKSARVDGDVKALAAVAAAPGGTPSMGVSRDNSIQYQSSRKDALEFVGLLVKAEAVKLPAKPADKLGALVALVDSFTASFFEDINTLGAVTRALEGGEAPESDAGEENGEE